MRATADGIRRVRGCWFGRLLVAAIMATPIGACGPTGGPDDSHAADGVPALPGASGDAGAAEPSDGSAAAESPGPDTVILNGEELPPELAAAFRQAIEERSPLPAGAAERLSGRRGPNAGAAPSPDDVGPDWSVVEAYLAEQRAWMDRDMVERMAERPDVRRAAAAARAILEQDGAHEKTVEAAEFLVLRVQSGGSVAENMVAGATGLLRHAPDYENWPRVLSAMEGRSFLGPEIGAFFEEMAAGAEDPVLRATGRYYVAAGLTQAANGSRFAPLSGWTSLSASLADSGAKRQQALEVATGLSAGAEEEPFLGAFPDRGPTAGMTLAEAEADLVRSIRHGTIGATLPEVIGTRVDGVEESLSDYRGRVVLLDFWATWCVPCIDVLPDLRKLVEELPADRFALVAISVDEELETVTRFMQDEPMPWTNWHAGLGSNIARLLRVQGYPTYVLVDEDGRILARPMGRFQEIALGAPADSFPGVSPSLPALIREALAGLPPA